MVRLLIPFSFLNIFVLTKELEKKNLYMSKTIIKKKHESILEKIIFTPNINQIFFRNLDFEQEIWKCIRASSPKFFFAILSHFETCEVSPRWLSCIGLSDYILKKVHTISVKKQTGDSHYTHSFRKKQFPNLRHICYVPPSSFSFLLEPSIVLFSFTCVSPQYDHTFSISSSFVSHPSNWEYVTRLKWDIYSSFLPVVQQIIQECKHLESLDINGYLSNSLHLNTKNLQYLRACNVSTMSVAHSKTLETFVDGSCNGSFTFLDQKEPFFPNLSILQSLDAKPSFFQSFAPRYIFDQFTFPVLRCIIIQVFDRFPHDDAPWIFNNLPELDSIRINHHKKVNAFKFIFKNLPKCTSLNLVRQSRNILKGECVISNCPLLQTCEIRNFSIVSIEGCRSLFKFSTSSVTSLYPNYIPSFKEYSSSAVSFFPLLHTHSFPNMEIIRLKFDDSLFSFDTRLFSCLHTIRVIHLQFSGEKRCSPVYLEHIESLEKIDIRLLSENVPSIHVICTSLPKLHTIHLECEKEPFEIVYNSEYLSGWIALHDIPNLQKVEFVNGNFIPYVSGTTNGQIVIEALIQTHQQILNKTENIGKLLRRVEDDEEDD